MKPKLFLLVVLSFCLATEGKGQGEGQQPLRPLTGQEVMAKVKENFERGVTTVVEEFSMVWTDKQRRSITRELIRREKKYEGGDKISLEVTSGKGEGIKVLIHEVREGTNLQWIKVGERVRQVDASDKSQRFLNGPTHEDLEFWHCKNFTDLDFNTQAMQEVELDGQTYYLVKAVPRNRNSSEYSSLEIWVETQIEDGVRVVKFTFQIKYYQAREGREGEELHKTLKVLGITRDERTGVYRPDHLELVEEAGYRTVFRTSRRQINAAIDDSFFSRRWLEK